MYKYQTVVQENFFGGIRLCQIKVHVKNRMSFSDYKITARNKRKNMLSSIV